MYKTSMVRKLRLNFVELAALIYGVKHFLENTPKRWSLVSQLVRSSCSKYSGTVNAVSMEVGFGNTPAVEFQGTEEHCKEAYQSIQTLSPEIFEYATIQSETLFEDGSHGAFKPIVLLPGKRECCGRKVYIR